MDLLSTIHAQSAKQLRQLCKQRGIATAALVEKADFRRAIVGSVLHEAPTKTLKSLRDAHSLYDLVDKDAIVDKLTSLILTRGANSGGGGGSSGGNSSSGGGSNTGTKTNPGQQLKLKKKSSWETSAARSIQQVCRGCV